MKQTKNRRKSLRLLAAVFFSLAFLGLFHAVSLAADYTLPVTDVSNITGILGISSPGESYTFELQNNITLKGGSFTVPAGVTVTLTNAPGKNITVTRDVFSSGSFSRINVQGTLIIRESADGSLIFAGGKVDFMEDPLICVSSAASSLEVDGGLFLEHYSYHGAIHCKDGATVTINGGTFINNKNTYDTISLSLADGSGGAIKAVECNLAINGGVFKENAAENCGGAIYYNGRYEQYRLTVTGGEFDGNSAEGLFGGGAICVDAEDALGKVTLGDFSGGYFHDNSAPGLGGAVYVQYCARVRMSRIVIVNNYAAASGGGIWNCPTGSASEINFNGMYLAGNSAGTAGDDFVSEKKNTESFVNISDFAFDGQFCGWTRNEAADHKVGAPVITPDSSYYQNSSAYCALKSGLNAENAPTGKILFENNFSGCGGAIANNGYLEIVDSTELFIEKKTTVETEETFLFTIFLTKDSEALADSFLTQNSDGAFGEIVFDADGKASFQLASGEGITILDLPTGTNYRIVEIAKDGWVLESSEHSTGTVIQPSNDAVVFTNAPITTGSLTVSKTVSGDGAYAQQIFQFTVTLTDQTITGEYGGMTFSGGVASFPLCAGETVTAEGLPGGIGFTVTESSNDGYTVSYTVDGEKADAAAGQIPVNGTIAVGIDNYREAPKTGSLTVSKTVSGDGADYSRSFQFTITLTDSSVQGIYGDVTFVNGTAVFTLKAQESKTAADLPADVGYTVRESINDGCTVSVNGTTDTEATGKIPGGDAAQAAFHNVMTLADAPDAAIVTLTAGKTLDGTAPTGSNFTFVLRKADGTMVHTAKNNGGTITFAPLYFADTGVYRYTITEQAGASAAVRYDSSIYTVVITVTEAGSRYAATVSFEKDGQAISGNPVFANTTRTEDTSVTTDPTETDTPVSTPPAETDTPVSMDPAETVPVPPITGDKTALLISFALLCVIGVIGCRAADRKKKN